MPALAGITVSPLRRPELLRLLREALDRNAPLRITFLNPDYARRALLSRALRDDINSCDLVLVDGNGVRLLTPLFGFTVPERLDTDSLAPDVFDELAGRGGSVFLFGCAPGVADAAGQRLVRDHPGLRIAGTLHGFFDVERGHPGRFAVEDSEEFVRLMNASGADAVVVSLPTPLQQRWVAEYGGPLTAALVMTAGSYLDHVAGTGSTRTTFYPPWVDRLQLNWLYRLAREPRRLWRRYTVELGHFVVLVVRARLRDARR